MADTTPFEKNLLSVVKGQILVKEMARTIVSGAVRDVISRIAQEYSLNCEELQQKFEVSVVDMHCDTSILNDDGQARKCMYTCSRTNKACTKAVLIGDYCHWHKEEGFAQQVKRQHTRRRVEEYKNSMDPLPLAQVPPSQDIV
jgi:replication initiation and membrane attachment protein DnaB